MDTQVKQEPIINFGRIDSLIAKLQHKITSIQKSDRVRLFGYKAVHGTGKFLSNLGSGTMQFANRKLVKTSYVGKINEGEN